MSNAAAVVALAAGLAVVAQRGSDPATSLDTSPVTASSATTTSVGGESPTNGLLPRFVIDDAGFFRSNGTSITIRLSDASRSDIGWLENSATEVDDAAWADLIDEITTAPLPDAIQEWRDWQILGGREPWLFTTESVG